MKNFFLVYRCGNILAMSLLAISLSLPSVATMAAADDKFAGADELGLMKGFPPPPDKQVTKATALRTAPFNRWSHQHMRMFYPSANVPPRRQAGAAQQDH